MNTAPRDYPKIEKYESSRTHETIENDGSVSSPSASTDETGAKMHFGFRQVVAIVSLCILWVGSQLPLYFIGATLSYVAKDLGGKAALQSSWIPVSNTLALAAVCPFSGYLTDIFGRRYVTLVGTLAIMVGSIIAATAHSFGQIITGMALSGVGAGIGELAALSGVAELVPVRKRGLYLGLVVAFLAPITPYVLYGQLLSTRTAQGWRWGQWIALIYNGVSFLGLVSCYFPERIQVIERPSAMETLKKIDCVGGLLSIVGVTLFLVALQSGGYTHPWSSAYVVAPLVIGIVLMLSFCFYEWKLAKHPMVPKEIFKGQRVVAIVFVITFVAGINFYSLINFFPLSFQTLYNDSTNPVQIGLKGLGYGISVTLGAVVIDILLSVLPKYNRELLLLSCVIMTAFIGGLAAVTPDNPKLNVALATIGGFGVGGIIVPASTVATTACPDALIGTTVALSLSVRLIGGSLGYTIYYNIFKNKLMSALPNVALAAVKAGLPLGEAETFVETLSASPESAAMLPGVTTAVLEAGVRALQEAYAYGFRFVWFASIAFGVPAIITCFFLPSNERFLTKRVAAKIRP